LKNNKIEVFFLSRILFDDEISFGDQGLNDWSDDEILACLNEN